MPKKFMCAASSLMLSVLIFMTSACAAATQTAPSETSPQSQDEVVFSQGMVYIPDCSVYFADINTKYKWAFHEIDYLANTGVVSGTGHLVYSPAKSLSRADFVLMLYRAYDMEKYAEGENFADVRDSAYYADAVRAARAIGIATGDSKNRFRPNDTLTRQDAMVLLKRTLDRTGVMFQTGDLSVFSDGDKVARYASEAVADLAKAGVINGSKGKLNPTAPVTRAEMAVMLYRALHLQKIGNIAIYLSQPAIRLVCVGSTIFADVRIENYEKDATYAGLYAMERMTKGDRGYSVTLGQAQPIDDTILWDGSELRVNDEIVPVAEDCEAIAVDMYSKRKAGLCSTGDEYSAGAVSIVDGAVKTVYYKK